MEKDTDSVLVKNGMQAFGTKLVHTYNCQFDKAVQGKTVGSSTKGRRNDCAAFVKVHFLPFVMAVTTISEEQCFR